MDLEKALETYRKTIVKSRDIHVMVTNYCPDHCAHCYADAGPRKDQYINKDDLSHLFYLFERESGSRIFLDGGDAFYHPLIDEIALSCNPQSRVEIRGSGLVLTKRNPQRESFLERMARIPEYAHLRQAAPGAAYHTINWLLWDEAREYIKEKNLDPSRFGYHGRLRTWLQTEGGRKDLSPVGRAKNLPGQFVAQGRSKCGEIPDRILIGPTGLIKYCYFSIDDGFMNIRDLRQFHEKEEAVKYIMERLSIDPTFQAMVESKRCYFSRKIPKKIEMLAQHL